MTTSAPASTDGRFARDDEVAAWHRDGWALLDGLIEGSPTALGSAEQAFARLDMRFHAAAAKFRRGELRDPAVCREATAELHGVARPDRVIEMFAPSRA